MATEGDHEYDDNDDGVAATTAPGGGRLGEVPVDQQARCAPKTGHGRNNEMNTRHISAAAKR